RLEFLGPCRISRRLCVVKVPSGTRRLRKTLNERCAITQGATQPSQVFGTPYLDGAQAGGVFGQHLDVEKLKVSLPQTLQQKHQGRLGSTPLRAEHRLAGKEAANRHAVEAAGQLLLLPNLHTMGVT